MVQQLLVDVAMQWWVVYAAVCVEKWQHSCSGALCGKVVIV